MRQNQRMVALPLAALFLVVDGGVFSPAPLDLYRGGSYAGIRIGSDRDKDIKQKFKTEKGAIRPEALKLATDRPRDYRVDALLDGRGGDAVVRALRIEYKDDAPTPENLREWFGSPSELWPDERYEPWGLLAWPDRGVAAAIVRGEVRVVYLGQPGPVEAAIKSWSDREPEVSPLPDPGEGWDRSVPFGSSFGNVSLGSNAPDGVNDNWKRSLETRINEMLQFSRSHQVAYDARSTGTISWNVTTTRFSDGGSSDVSVTINLSSSTPYGPISASGSSSRRLGSVTRDRVQRIADDAFANLERNAKSAVDRQKPPTAESYRQRALARFEKDLTAW